MCGGRGGRHWPCEWDIAGSMMDQLIKIINQIRGQNVKLTKCTPSKMAKHTAFIAKTYLSTKSTLSIKCLRQNV